MSQGVLLCFKLVRAILFPSAYDMRMYLGSPMIFTRAHMAVDCPGFAQGEAEAVIKTVATRKLAVCT